MKMGMFFTLCILAAALSKVEGHGGLAVPYTWVDIAEIGDKRESFELGCSCPQVKDGKKIACALQSIKGHEDKILFPNKNKIKRRLNGPNCYFLFLNDASMWPKKDEKRLPKNKKQISRMPRNMFIFEINNTLARYQHLADRADKCSTADLSTTKGYEDYRRRCDNPWHQPGLTTITSPCGVSGGIVGAAEAPFGQNAEFYSYPNAPTTVWNIGNAERVVWNIHANHAGGYSYRLCKVPRKGIKRLTEKCFQRTHLKFNGTTHRVRAEGETTWTETNALDTTIGTWPKGSMWRKNHYFTVGTCMDHANCGKGITSETLASGKCGKCRGEIEDYVLVPQKLRAGDYVLSWRWDAEGSPQIWNGCSNIKLVMPS